MKTIGSACLAAFAALSGCGDLPGRRGNPAETGTAPSPANEARAARAATPHADQAGVPAEQGRPALSDGLCRPGEAILFQCAMRGRLVSVCGGRSPSGRNYTQYRFGSRARLELEYPRGQHTGPGSFTWARTGYSGGGELQMRFSNEGVEYVVYSRVIRTGFGPEGNFDPDYQAGVLVRTPNGRTSDRRCDDSFTAMLGTAEPSGFMPEGQFVTPPY